VFGEMLNLAQSNPQDRLCMHVLYNDIDHSSDAFLVYLEPGNVSGACKCKC